MTGLVARFATAHERNEWDHLIAANPGGGEVWQGNDYLEQKRHGRYTPHRLIIEKSGERRYAVGVLAKRVPLLGTWWHVPAGPRPLDRTELPDIVDAIATFARPQGAFLLKIEPRVTPDAEFLELAEHRGWRRGARIVPNDSTVLVDISGEESDVFARIGKKARNSINRAGRDGITVRRVEATDEHSLLFARLLAETAEGKFVMRSNDYYRSYWQRFQKSGTGQMFFAERDGTLLAAAFVMILGENSTYKDGASLRDKQAYGASHALQWEAIRWANEHGATLHDLCGAPPSDRVDDTTHPLHGVGRFKRSFQPEITDYAGLYDVPLSGWKVRLWSAVLERIARRWSLAIHKDPYY